MAVNTNSGAQLPLEASVVETTKVLTGASTWLFPTNRSNLLEVMSSGLLAPIETFDKYYDDLQRFAPGRVVLLQGESDGGASALSYDPTTPGSFPVLIEVDTAIPTDTPVTHASSVNGQPEITVAAVGHLVPAARGTVHFRKQDELDEHRLNDYENVDHNQMEYTVSPELFASTPPMSLATWLAEIARGPQIGDVYRKLDQVTGGLELAAIAMARFPHAIEGFAAVLNREIPPPSAGPGGWPTWITASALLDEGDKPKAGQADERAFRALALAFTASTPSEGIRPADVIDEARSQATRGRIGKADAAALETAFAAARTVVTLERDFIPDDPSITLASVQGAVYALLRPDAMRLLRFFDEERPADSWAAITAATLVGMHVGRRRLPTAARVAALDRHLATWTVSAIDGDGPERTYAQLSAEGSDGQATIVTSSETLLTVEIPTPSLADLLQSADLASTPAREVALELARHQRWNECIRNRIYVPDGTHALGYDRREKSMFIEFVGPIRVERTIERDGFLTRLTSSEIPQEIQDLLRPRLEEHGSKRLAST